MRATFVCDGSETRLVGEWTLKPFAPSYPIFEAHFQAAGSSTEMHGLLYGYPDRDEFLIDGSTTTLAGKLRPDA